MNYHFITIEGNIGAGKTTLAHLISKRLNARLILEEFADNPFLPKFYENPDQFAFPLELFFMSERYKQLKDLLHTKDLFQNVTVSDYLFTKCLLFDKVNLPRKSSGFTKSCLILFTSNCFIPTLLLTCMRLCISCRKI